MLTAIGPLRLRSSGAHCARTLAVEVQRCSLRSDLGGGSPAVLTAIGPWRLRSSGAHCDPELAKRIYKKLGEEDWREAWRRGLARSLANRIGEEDWPGGGDGKEEE